MKPLCSSIKSIQIACLLALMSIIISLNASSLSIQKTDKTVDKLYHTLNANSKLPMSARLDILSGSFLGEPYVLGALGEGATARFDQSPLYRTDGFDCETFVTTVLALALGNNPQTFKECLKKLRYLNGKVDFTTRNHFTSLDWNQNNQKQGFVQDITLTIKNRQNLSVAKMAVALIDKPSWYEHFNETHIKLIASTPEEQKKRLAELKIQGSKLPKTQAKIPYLPFTALFDEQGNPDQQLFAQIPNASIIEIVRPNWDLREQIGTCLNVSHLGFAFWKKGELIFRQASSNQGKVIDVSLIDYLKSARSSPTIKGINVQVVIPEKPLAEGCQVPK